jgi:hypothetical protein
MTQYAFDWSRETARPVLTVALSEISGRPADNSFLEREIALVVGGGLQKRMGSVVVSAVGEVGALGVTQQGSNRSRVFAVQPRVDAQVGGAWYFARALSLDVSLAGGALLVTTEERRHLQPFVMAGGGVGWTW